MKQKSLFKMSDYSSEFGGSIGANKRKTARPLSPRNPIHHIMKSTSSKFLFEANFASKTIDRFARRFNIKIHRKAIVSNHIHLALGFDNKVAYQNFSRAINGVLAKSLKIKWVSRPYTRIVSWGREFKNLCEYVERNHFEAVGIVEFKERKRKRPG